MNTTYQQLLSKWSTLAPDECSTTDKDYRFKVRILPTVETITLYSNSWRIINSEELIIKQLNFILLTILHHCATKQYSISFTFGHLHPAIAALDAYIQLLEFENNKFI